MKHFFNTFSEEHKKILRFSAEGTSGFVSSLENSKEQSKELTEDEKQEQAVLEIENMIATSPRVAEELGDYLRKQENGETEKNIEAVVNDEIVVDSVSKKIDVSAHETFINQCDAWLNDHGNPTEEFEVRASLGKNYDSYLNSKEIVRNNKS